jgi:hypothetical protein
MRGLFSPRISAQRSPNAGFEQFYVEKVTFK